MTYDKRKWNSIINKTPIFFSTNRYIGGVAPSEYINKIVRNKGLTEGEILKFINTHFINVEMLINNNFERFIIDRAIKLLDAIESVTGKKITDRTSEEVVNYFGEELN